MKSPKLQSELGARWQLFCACARAAPAIVLLIALLARQSAFAHGEISVDTDVAALAAMGAAGVEAQSRLVMQDGSPTSTSTSTKTATGTPTPTKTATSTATPTGSGTPGDVPSDDYALVRVEWNEKGDPLEANCARFRKTQQAEKLAVYCVYYWTESKTWYYDQLSGSDVIAVSGDQPKAADMVAIVSGLSTDVAEEVLSKLQLHPPDGAVGQRAETVRIDPGDRVRASQIPPVVHALVIQSLDQTNTIDSIATTQAEELSRVRGDNTSLLNKVENLEAKSRELGTTQASPPGLGSSVAGRGMRQWGWLALMVAIGVAIALGGVTYGQRRERQTSRRKADGDDAGKWDEHGILNRYDGPEGAGGKSADRGDSARVGAAGGTVATGGVGEQGDAGSEALAGGLVQLAVVVGALRKLLGIESEDESKTLLGVLSQVQDTELRKQIVERVASSEMDDVAKSDPVRAVAQLVSERRDLVNRLRSALDDHALGNGLGVAINRLVVAKADAERLAERLASDVMSELGSLPSESHGAAWDDTEDDSSTTVVKAVRSVVAWAKGIEKRANEAEAWRQALLERLGDVLGMNDFPENDPVRTVRDRLQVESQSAKSERQKLAQEIGSALGDGDVSEDTIGSAIRELVRERKRLASEREKLVRSLAEAIGVADVDDVRPEKAVRELIAAKAKAEDERDRWAQSLRDATGGADGVELQPDVVVGGLRKAKESAETELASLKASLAAELGVDGSQDLDLVEVIRALAQERTALSRAGVGAQSTLDGLQKQLAAIVVPLGYDVLSLRLPDEEVDEVRQLRYVLAWGHERSQGLIGAIRDTGGELVLEALAVETVVRNVQQLFERINQLNRESLQDTLVDGLQRGWLHGLLRGQLILNTYLQAEPTFRSLRSWYNVTSEAMRQAFRSCGIQVDELALLQPAVGDISRRYDVDVELTRIDGARHRVQEQLQHTTEFVVDVATFPYVAIGRRWSGEVFLASPSRWE